MAVKDLKSEALSNALNALDVSIQHFEAVKISSQKDFPKFDYEVVFKAARDSMIQRFEFTIELFWKYLKMYLETKLVKVESNTPSEVIRSGCRARLISESDSESFMRMLKSRNFTSHIYKEELAERLAAEISKFYDILKRNFENVKS